MKRDGRGTGGRSGTSDKGAAEHRAAPEPGKRTLTEQLGSEARRSPPLFGSDAQWETMEELEAQLGDGEAVDPRVAAHVSRATGQDVSGARVHRGPVVAAMGAIGDVMRTGLQLQRCAEIKPAKVTELRGKEAEAKLAAMSAASVPQLGARGDDWTRAS